MEWNTRKASPARKSRDESSPATGRSVKPVQSASDKSSVKTAGVSLRTEGLTCIRSAISAHGRIRTALIGLDFVEPSLVVF